MQRPLTLGPNAFGPIHTPDYGLYIEVAGFGDGPAQEGHNERNLLPIHVFLSTEQVSPDGSGKDGVTLDQALVVGGQDAAPLQKQVLEVFVSHAPSGHVVQQDHLVLGGAGEVFDQVALVVLELGRRVDRAHPHRDDVHVEERDLGPGGKGGRQAYRLEPPGVSHGVAEVDPIGCLGRSLAREDAHALILGDGVIRLCCTGFEKCLRLAVGDVRLRRPLGGLAQALSYSTRQRVGHGRASQGLLNLGLHVCDAGTCREFLSLG